MIRNFSTGLMIIGFTALVYGVFLYMAFHKNDVCDKLVRFNDGTQIEAKDVRSYDNGMTTITTCTDEALRTPTLNIKMIEEIKTPQQ